MAEELPLLPCPFLRADKSMKSPSAWANTCAFPAGLLMPPNTDCSVGYPYQLTGLIFPFAYETSAFVHDRCTVCTILQSHIGIIDALFRVNVPEFHNKLQ